MEIIFDCREHALINEFANVESCDVTVKQLDIGDIVVSYNGQMKIIFERKTIPDLLSSINDGRHREQKFRMKEFRKTTNCTVVYIYEGDVDFNGAVSSVNGAYINSIFRDKIQIINTRNLKSTKHFLLSLFEKLKSKPEIYLGENCSEDVYDSCILKTKKKNINKDNVLVNQISCIRGFSYKNAKAITDHFNVSNIRELISIVEKQKSENKKDPLLEIAGIGKKMSSAFYEMLGL
jgi:ERCC4-type nuclease